MIFGSLSHTDFDLDSDSSDFKIPFDRITTFFTSGFDWQSISTNFPQISILPRILFSKKILKDFSLIQKKVIQRHDRHRISKKDEWILEHFQPTLSCKILRNELFPVSVFQRACPLRVLSFCTRDFHCSGMVKPGHFPLLVGGRFSYLFMVVFHANTCCGSHIWFDSIRLFESQISRYGIDICC